MVDVPAPTDQALAHLSSYQWMTAGRLLARAGIELAEKEVMVLLQHRQSFYYQLLLVPMMNVLNGIILDQAKEYQLFLQKLFVDYLMSGQADNDTADSGALIRQSLEQERVKMIEGNKRFEALQGEHHALIVTCQAALLALTKEWATALKTACAQGSQENLQISFKAAQQLFLQSEGCVVSADGWGLLEKTLGGAIPPESRASFESLSRFSTPLEAFITENLPLVRAQTLQFNEVRSAYYADILRVQELLYAVPLYQFDEPVDQKNRERLIFDTSIGAPQDSAASE
jgi:hypothetical protein